MDGDGSFLDRLGAIEGKEAALDRAILELEQELERVSLSFEGNQPEEYFTPSEVAECRQFLDVAIKRGVEAQPLRLEAPRSRRPLSGTTANTRGQTEFDLGSSLYSTLTRTKGLGMGARSVPLSRRKVARAEAEWETLWRGSGFEVGRITPELPGEPISVARWTRVYLCTDGRLRCHRSRHGFRFKARAVGFGDLPAGWPIETGCERAGSGEGPTVMIFQAQPLADVLLSHLGH